MKTRILETKIIPPARHEVSCRKSHEIRAFITLFAAVFLASMEGAWALPVGVRPGQQVQLYGALMAIAFALAGQKYFSVCIGYLCYARASGYFSGSSAVADVFNTAGCHSDVLTPGGSHSSLSGTSYLAAVPAPAAVWLLGSGLLGMAWRSARKNQSDPPV